MIILLQIVFYNLSYYCHDKKTTEQKEVASDDMASAVKKIIDTATRRNIKISHISCTVKGSRGVQRFCDDCQVNMAMFGIGKKPNNKFICRECKNGTQAN